MNVMIVWKLTLLILFSLVVTSFVIPGNFNDASALTKSTIKRPPNNAFGANTNVCGVELCNEKERVSVCGEHLCKDNKTSTPSDTLKIIDIHSLGKHSFQILMKSGVNTANLTSYYLSSDYEIKPLVRISNDYVVTDYMTYILKAFDPSTIKLVENLSNANPLLSLESPKVKLLSVDQTPVPGNLYRIVFEITPTDFNMKNISVKVFSDTDSLTYSIGGVFMNSIHTNQVEIKAHDPDSIGILILNQNINQ